MNSSAYFEIHDSINALMGSWIRKLDWAINVLPPHNLIIIKRKQTEATVK
jgi:hypothetical protein